MKITIDSQVLSIIWPGIVPQNKGDHAGRISMDINLGQPGEPIGVSPLNIIDRIVDMGQVLDEQNIPETGRWLVIPPWVAAMIKKSDLRNASISGDGISMTRNGRLGMIELAILH